MIKFALSMGLILQPVARVPGPIRPDLHPIAVPHVVHPLALVDHSGGERVGGQGFAFVGFGNGQGGQLHGRGEVVRFGEFGFRQ
jgi:hypothetical protein